MIATVSITLLLSIFIFRLLDKTINLHLPSVGTIHISGVKVYSDETLKNETTQILWGTIYPGSSTNVTLYVRSVSNVKTTLALKTANWTFLNSSGMIVYGTSNNTPYMNLTWNYSNTIVNPGETIPVTLTLTTAGATDFVEFLVNKEVKEFTFDISIYTVEEP
jgi:hypothetical protein